MSAQEAGLQEPERHLQTLFRPFELACVSGTALAILPLALLIESPTFYFGTLVALWATLRRRVPTELLSGSNPSYAELAFGGLGYAFGSATAAVLGILVFIIFWAMGRLVSLDPHIVLWGTRLISAVLTFIIVLALASADGRN